MAKSVNPDQLDAALDYLIANGSRMDICAGAPTTYTQATDTNSLGNTALVGGDYSKAAGDVSGRKVTVAAKSGVSIGTGGTADHIAITNGTDNLVLVTELASSQPVTEGNTADIGSFKQEFQDPA